jgi:hypothetical protein
MIDLPALLKEARSRISAFFRRVATLRRALVLVYIVVVVVFACFRPWPHSAHHFIAVRDLPAGSRLSNELLTTPPGVAIEDRVRQLVERGSLIGHYLRVDARAGDAILPKQAQEWPKLDDPALVPIELKREPNWIEVNAGAWIQVWIGGCAAPFAVRIAAVVPAGQSGWVALVKGDGFTLETLAKSNNAPVWRVASLPTLTPPAGLGRAAAPPSAAAPPGGNSDW